MSMAALEKRMSNFEQAAEATNQVHVERRGDGFYFPFTGREYQPSNTGKMLHDSDSFISAAMGPVGSGKSTMCCMKSLDETIKMPPCKDGVRRSKWVMIRNTYPELKLTTLATFLDWFRGFGNHSLNQNPPVTYSTIFYDKDGRIEWTVVFIALDNQEDVKKLMSMDVTGGFINEARYVPEIVLNILMERVGRYPAIKWLTDIYKAKILMDTNPPDTDSWWYRRFEQDRNKDEIILKQPAGLLDKDGGYITNPEAENLDNLPADYYIRNAQGRPKSEINVQLMGQYGSFVEGDPIYTSYNDDIHSVEHLEFTPGLPIYIGWDYGLTPACLLGQLTPRGQFQAIKEFTSEDMFLESFLDNIVLPYKEAYLTGYSFISVGDPAGHTRKDTDAKTCEDVLKSRGIPTESCITNSIAARLGAQDKMLTRMIGGQPAYVLSRTGCPKLRKGFQGGYCWKKVGGEKMPDKNQYSHIHDGGQYIAVKIMGVEKKPAKNDRKVEFLPAGYC